MYARSTVCSNLRNCGASLLLPRASSAAIGCPENSAELTWYLTFIVPVVRSTLYRAEGENEKRGSGVTGVEKRLGSALRIEKASRRNSGRSCIHADRGSAACCS